MARMPKPWFRKQTGWWMVTLGGRQHKLAEGRENKKVAQKRFHELQLLVAEAPGSSNARVASVCDAFLEWSQVVIAISMVVLGRPDNACGAEDERLATGQTILVSVPSQLTLADPTKMTTWDRFQAKGKGSSQLASEALTKTTASFDGSHLDKLNF
jgi:hypothetical protein